MGGGDAKRKQILNLGSDSGARGRVIVCSQNGQELMTSHCSAGCERVVRGERVPMRKHLETWKFSWKWGRASAVHSSGGVFKAVRTKLLQRK